MHQLQDQGPLPSQDLKEAPLQQYEIDGHIPFGQVKLVVEYKAA